MDTTSHCMRPTIFVLRFLILITAVTVVFTCWAQSGNENALCEQTTHSRKTTNTASVKPSENITQNVQVICTPKDSQSTSATQKAEKQGEVHSMDYVKLIEAISKLLGSIAWPVAIVVIARHYKKELAELLTRLKKIRAGSTEAEFELGVNEAVVAAGIDDDAKTENASKDTMSVVELDPRGAILGAWLEVEKAFFALCDAQGIIISSPRKMRSVLPAMKAIEKAGALDYEHISLFHDLRSLRNTAAHNIDFNPKPGAVILYTRAAKQLSDAISKAAKGVA